MQSLHKRLNHVQKTAVDKALNLLNTEGKCLIVMTTGTGKTRVGAKIIEEFAPTSQVLWLTQTEELITQTFLDLQSIFGEGAIGLYKRAKRSTSERIIVASLQTIEKEEYLKAIPRKFFELLIVDEAHHSRAQTWERVIRYFHCKKLGLTATPSRHDDKDIEDLFGDAAFHLSYEEAKELKLIAEETYRVILTNSKVEGLSTKTGDYQPNALDRLVISENRNEIIVNSYKRYGRTFMRNLGLPKKTICFCITVRHALRMKELFLSHGIKADVLVSKHSYFWGAGHGNPQTERERREVYQSFLNGMGPEVLCVVNVLNEGKNIPDVSCLLMARPTRSRIIFQQELGRGCRRIEGLKEKFIVLDYVDQMRPDLPPMSLSRLTGKSYKAGDIIAHYYRGKDPLVVNQVIEYLSEAHPFFPEPKWTREKVGAALKEFYEKHGIIRGNDLITQKTGLPNRTTIKRYWPSVEECFKDLNIHGVLRKIYWTKEEVEQALKVFLRKHGSIGIVDLCLKNKLPSKKTIKRYWGSWRACERELELNTSACTWDPSKILASLKAFEAKRGRRPKKNELTRAYDLPPYQIIRKNFGNLRKALQKTA